jgi:hypothetical protein
MKMSRVRRALTLAACACALAGTARAQLVVAGGASNAVQSPLGASSGYASGIDRSSQSSSATAGSLRVAGPSGERAVGAFVINRFGVRDGRMVAYGRFVPVADEDLAASSSAISGDTYRGVLLSSPAEPAGGYGASPELGAGSRISLATLPRSSATTDRAASLGMASSAGASIGASMGATVSAPRAVVRDVPFDASALGSWTGRGTGYGESGVESRSRLLRDSDRNVAPMTLARPYDDQSYMDDITWNGDYGTNGSSDLEAGMQQSLGSTGVASATSALDRSASLAVAVDRPLIRLGGTAGLYDGREALRALVVAASSEDIPVPVAVVDATCNGVALSFNGGDPVTLTPSGDEGDAFCRLADARATHVSEGSTAMMLKYLNQLIQR